MSAPTARDRETAARTHLGIEEARIEVCSVCERIARALAAERARVLDLTPEEAGRLWREALNDTSRALFQAWDRHATIPLEQHDSHAAMAFLAALKARAES